MIICNNHNDNNNNSNNNNNNNNNDNNDNNVGHHSFWSIDLDDLWSKKICRPEDDRLIIGATFILRWSCSMYFLPYAKQNQAEVLPRFQR